MRAFRVGDGEDGIYTYDACIEFLCEKALEAFLESGGSWTAAVNGFKKSIRKEFGIAVDGEINFGKIFRNPEQKYGSEEMPKGLIEARIQVGNNLDGWLADPNQRDIIIEDYDGFYGETLTAFYNDLNDKWYIDKEHLENCCVAPLWVRSIWHIPLAFHLCLRLGLIADLNWWCLDGIGHSFQKNIIRIWQNAIDQLHPFQHGPTHQGTKHCIQVHNNFCALKYFVENYGTPEANKHINRITANEWGLMSVAAALHDIGKADIIVSLGDHAINGAIAIRSTPSKQYKITPGYKNFVANIVDTHSPDGRYKIISNVGHGFYRIQGTNYLCWGKIMKTICSLFHLADVMDTTRDRVSDPFIATLKTLYGSDPGDKGDSFRKIEEISKARKGMIALKITPTNIEVYLSSDPDLEKEARKRIPLENADLMATGAWDTLGSRSLPKELFAVP